MVQTAITAVICTIIVSETFSTNLLCTLSMEAQALDFHKWTIHKWNQRDQKCHIWSLKECY